MNNPLLENWDTPFEIPPFDRIGPEHYRDAFNTAIEQHSANIEEIASNDAVPTFQNTVEAMELAGEALQKVSATFFNLSGSHTNPQLQEIEREMAPKLAAHHSQIMLNEALFTRVDALFETQNSMALTPEQKRVLERYHASFVRSGARLEGEERAKISNITQKLATLGTRFSQNVLADESDYELVLMTQADLAGLPDFLIAAAASAAEERGHGGKHVITLSRSLIEPFLQFSDRRDLRERAFRAWIARGENGGETDNREIIIETLKLREDRAKLLGFETFADFKL
ncbi:MAG: M3 family metallopeptidase, partial [Pseudomonadota bacterium]